MALSFKPIRPLLQTGTNAASRWFSYIGLGIGVLLLLCSIQMFVNIQQLLKEGTLKKEGADFFSITKVITNETMGQREKNIFHEDDINELKKQPFILGVSPLISNDFRVKLGAGGVLNFSTDMFLETLENDFIDTIPPNFAWQEGQLQVPMILSANFFEIYNVFAPGQDLPQVSRETAMGIPVDIECEGNGNKQVFRAQIVAFSDRVNSVLVPKTFLDWANKYFGSKTTTEASRLFIKARDINDPALLNYFDSKNYKLNKDSTLLGRNKMVIQGIFSGLGVFGLLVVVLALLLFSFYLQLVIARSKESLQLLLILGYSPAWLSKNVSKRFIPVYIFIVLAALLVAELMQLAFHGFIMYNRPEIPAILHWSVFALAVALVLLSVLTNYRLVSKLLKQLHQ